MTWTIPQIISHAKTHHKQQLISKLTTHAFYAHLAGEHAETDPTIPKPIAAASYRIARAADVAARHPSIPDDSLERVLTLKFAAILISEQQSALELARQDPDLQRYIHFLEEEDHS